MIYQNLVVSSKQLSGSCLSWIDFQNGLNSAFSNSAVFRKIDFMQINDLRSTFTRISCSNSAVVRNIIQGFVYPNDIQKSYYCNRHDWVLERCSLSTSSISMCIDCTSPCKSNFRVVSPCSGTVQITANEIGILGVSYDKIQGPVFINSGISVGQYNASIVLSADREGFVVCVSSLLSYSSSVLFSKSAFVPSGRLPVQVLFSGLQPSTAYVFNCSISSDANSQLFEEKDIVSFVSSTRCCRKIYVELKVPLVMIENSIVTDFISVWSDSQDHVDVSFRVLPSPMSATSSCLVFPSASTTIDENEAAFTRHYLGIQSCSVGKYIVSAETGSNELKIVYLHGNIFYSNASLAVKISPTILTATISPDLRFVVVQFSNTIEIGFPIISNVFSCDKMFIFRGSKSSQCSVSDSTSIRILLDTNSIILVGNSITLLPGVVYSSGSEFLYASTQAVTLMNSLVVQNPIVIMNAKTTLNVCEDLIIDLSTSLGSGGRSWAKITLFVSKGGRIASNSNFTATSTVVKVYSNYFSGGESYLVTAKMCNFVGACATGSITVYVSSSLLPFAWIRGPKVQTFKRSSSVALSAQILSEMIPSCLKFDLSVLTFQWTLAIDGLESAQYFSQAKVPTEYYLPEYSLKAGLSYLITLMVYDSRSGAMATDTRSLIIEPEPIVSVISGGDLRYVMPLSVQYIDGTSSFDKDLSPQANGLDSNLRFFWYCNKVFPVFSLTCPVIIENTAATVATVKIGGLASGTKIQLFLQVTKDSRSDVSSVILEVNFNVKPTIYLFVDSGLTFPSEGRLALYGKIEWPRDFPIASVNASWSLSTTDLRSSALSRINFSPIDSVIVDPSGISLSTANLIIQTAYLPIQPTYSFQLTISDASFGLVSSNTLTIQRNIPPNPGTILTDPTQGTEGITMFRLTASLWDDENLPLVYQFMLKSYTESVVPLSSMSLVHEVFCHDSIHIHVYTR
jgi:hypothetical protein